MFLACRQGGKWPGGNFTLGDRCPGITTGARAGKRQRSGGNPRQRTSGPEMASQSAHSKRESSQEIKWCWFWTSALRSMEHVAVLRSISFNEAFLSCGTLQSDAWAHLTCVWQQQGPKVTYKKNNNNSNGTLHHHVHLVKVHSRIRTVHLYRRMSV